MKRKSVFLSDGRLSVLLIAVILIIDQIIKVTVKTNMCLGESIRVTDWFLLSSLRTTVWHMASRSSTNWY